MTTPLPLQAVRPATPGDSSSDAVTTYFEQLARVPLLTREGEVELAKRIEEGERRALRAIVASSVGARELGALGRALRDRKVRLRDVTRATVDDESGDDEDSAGRAIGEALERAASVARAGRAGVRTREELAEALLEVRLARARLRPCGRQASGRARRRPPCRADVPWTPPSPQSGQAKRQSERAKAEPHRREPAPRRLDREALPEPRTAPPGSHPGRQPRADACGGQVRVQARLQIQHVRELVDPAERQPRHQRSGAHDSHPRAHGRDAQQALEDAARHGSGGRRRTDPGANRGSDERAGREDPHAPRGHPRPGQPGLAGRRGRRRDGRRFRRGPLLPSAR